MRVVLALVGLVLLSTSASAQRGRPIAEKGDVALVAQLSPGGGFGLLPALGGVGVRYRLTDRNVVGTSLGFSYGTGERDQADQSAYRLTAALWNESHLGRGRGVVSPFVGGGVRLAIARSDADLNPCGGDPRCDPFPVRRTARTEQLAAGALVGAEVRLARGVTLGGAYTLGVEAVRSRYSETGTQTFPSDAWEVRVGTGVTDLMLSVYF